MKRILLYIFWGNLFPNPSSPIFSIATFRNFDSTTPIFVLDYSNENWGVFPSFLNFQVIKTFPKITKFVKFSDTFHGYGHFQNNNLSRPFEISDFSKQFDSETLIVHSDNDIFYLQDIFPLEKECSVNFCCGKDNNGFFYFKNNNQSEDFFEEWKMKTIRSVTDVSFRNSLLKKAKRLNENKNELFHNEIISCSMNYDYYNSQIYNVRISKKNTPLKVFPKCIHILNAHWGRNKGFLPLIIKETRDSILNILKDSHIKTISKYFFSRSFEIMKVDKDTIKCMKKMINSLI